MSMIADALSLAAQLRPRVEGTVLERGDAEYDEGRRAWNLTVDQYPALILLAQSADDVAAAVAFAAERGLPVAVQSTGHGVSMPPDDALLIRTSAMTRVEVNPIAQTAWVEAGAKWGMVLEQTQKADLAPLLGSSPDVGVTGYTLGGGMGWLARKYGLAADSVRVFEVVTAEGQQVRASAEENSDLFWALRGGGGSFAIVTAMEIQLYPVATVYGGNLIYPMERAPQVFARYREWIAAAPDELTSSVVIMNFPPFPQVPEMLRGQSFVMVRGCYCGPASEGEALLRSWREWQPPLMDAWGEMPFTEVASISNDPVDPVPGVSSGAWMAELSEEAVEILLRYGKPAGGPPTFTFVEVRHAGGAIARGEAGSGAFSNRHAPLSLQMVAMTPTPEIKAGAIETIDRFKDELAPYLTGGVYMNFVEGEEAIARTKDGYSAEAFDRLMALKGQYDGENRFRFGFAIPPVKEIA